MSYDKRISFKDFKETAARKDVTRQFRKRNIIDIEQDIKFKYFKKCPELGEEFIDNLRVLNSIVSEAGHKQVILRIK